MLPWLSATIWISICFGFSTNFSKKTLSSPKAFNASRLLSLKAPFNSYSFRHGLYRWSSPMWPISISWIWWVAFAPFSLFNRTAATPTANKKARTIAKAKFTNQTTCGNSSALTWNAWPEASSSAELANDRHSIWFRTRWRNGWYPDQSVHATQLVPVVLMTLALTKLCYSKRTCLEGQKAAEKPVFSTKWLAARKVTKDVTPVPADAIPVPKNPRLRGIFRKVDILKDQGLGGITLHEYNWEYEFRQVRRKGDSRGNPS